MQSLIRIAFILLLIPLTSATNNHSSVPGAMSLMVRTAVAVSDSTVVYVSPHIETRADSLTNYAQKFLGKPYKYGSMSGNAFDCSGFVCYVYSKFGFQLPHSSSALSQMGQLVQLQDAQPGDLLFFTLPGVTNETSSHAGHVTMVLSNDEQGLKMIHSSTYRGVVIDELMSSEHYMNRFLLARRIL